MGAVVTFSMVADFPAGHEFARDTRIMSRNMRMAVQLALREAGKGLRDDLRNDIRRSGLGQRGGKRTFLPGLVTMRRPPERALVEDREPFAIVFARDLSASRILSAHATGGTFRPQATQTFAIPVHAHRKGRKLLDPAGIERMFNQDLHFVPSRGNRDMVGRLVLRDVVIGAGGKLRRATKRRLAAGAARVEATMFLLVRQFRLRKVLHPERVAARWASRLPALTERELRRLRSGEG